MKTKGIIVMIGIIGLITLACKKDINPVVIITVEDTTGEKLENARIFTHPCFDAGCDTTRINEAFIKEVLTNGSGQVTIEYPYSAIIDVIGNYTNCDTANNEWCMYEGRTVARFESKRAKGGESNEYNVKLVLRLQ